MTDALPKRRFAAHTTSTVRFDDPRFTVIIKTNRQGASDAEVNADVSKAIDEAAWPVFLRAILQAITDARGNAVLRSQVPQRADTWLQNGTHVSVELTFHHTGVSRTAASSLVRLFCDHLTS